MQIIIYDGSFFGLISALRYVIENNISVLDIKAKDYYKKDLFSTPINIKTNLKEADAFLSDLSQISEDFKRVILFAYHSEVMGIEMRLLSYIKIALESGGFPYDYANPDVNFILRITKRVGREVHRFKGFLRFQEMEDKSLFATISPEYNIIPFLARYFSKRISNEKWTIFDTRRHIVSKWDGRKISIYIDKQKRLLPQVYSENEIDVQTLWRAYFREICIQSRKNLRLQRHFVPLKYWRYLTELNI